MTSQKNSHPVISFQNVSFTYDGRINVIKGASFDVSPGEFIGIIGPNGGGKTTALKLMLGFLKPKEGKIVLRGKVGYVPQARVYDHQFPITLKEVVMTGSLSLMNLFGKYPKGVSDKAEEWLFKFDLQDLKDQAIGSLSGGQVQKGLIARALISDPEILLLDEPTANIDVMFEKQIFTFLQELRGVKTILVVTHNFDAIAQSAERVICFQNEVSSMQPKEVCNHFSIGMYHQTKGSLDD